jgi:hypothetical protein
MILIVTLTDDALSVYCEFIPISQMTKFNDIHRVFIIKYHCIYKQNVLICQSVYYCLSS